MGTVLNTLCSIKKELDDQKEMNLISRESVVTDHVTLNRNRLFEEKFAILEGKCGNQELIRTKITAIELV